MIGYIKECMNWCKKILKLIDKIVISGKISLDAVIKTRLYKTVLEQVRDDGSLTNKLYNYYL